jgi:putative ABC transport system permease protein
MDVPEAGAAPADLMGMLLLSKVALGSSPVLSGILVVNLLTALLAAQVRQIGVMKAVGGTRWLIARIYLAQALLLGAAAWSSPSARDVGQPRAVPLPGGVLELRHRELRRTGLGLPARSLVACWSAAAAYPVARGTRISLREALADYGVADGAFGTTAFDRVLASLSGTTRPLLLSLRNAFRRRARLALTLATLSAGGVFFMSALNVRASLVRTIDRLFDSVKYDLTVGLGGCAAARDARARGAPDARRPASGGWVAGGDARTRGQAAPASEATRGRTRGTGGAVHGTAASPRIASRSSPCRRDRTSWRPTSSKGAACGAATRTRSS